MTREEAIKRIKDWNLDDDDMEVLSTLIPELQEDSDERIVRDIIAYIQYERKSTEEEIKNRFIPWLKKQGEQKMKTEPKDVIDAPLIDIPFGAKDSELIGATYFIPKGFHAEIEDDEVIFKKGEQKSAWSKENSCYYDDICGILINLINSPKSNVNKDVVQKGLDWLMSVKESQSKQELKEETSDNEYIDLGLPSGTLWKSVNEEGYYTYDEAVEKFEYQLPNRCQCEELKDKCSWQRKDNGYNVIGPNGKSIFLPIAGFRYGKTVLDVDKYGLYWTNTYYNEDNAYVLGFYDDFHIFVDSLYRNTGRSVRLVKSSSSQPKKCTNKGHSI